MDDKPACKYGVKCYQKNPDHLAKYSHPDKRQSLDNSSPTKDEVPAKRKASPKPEEVSKRLCVTTSGNSAKYSDAVNFIKNNFLATMPLDFYSFWEFYQEAKNAEKMLDTLGFQLVGPYDVLSKKFEGKTFGSDEYLRHWRFGFDPPEFQTILVMKNGFRHWGYWRDSPTDIPTLIAYNDPSNKGNESKITFVSTDIFGLLINYIEKEFKCSPFQKMEIDNFKKLLVKWRTEKGFNEVKLDKEISDRNKKAVCRLMNQAGLVVPYDKKTQVGYRPLDISYGNLKKHFDRFVTADLDEQQIGKILSPYSTACSIAVDESDFATSIEFGMNLFSSGNPKLHNFSLRLLKNGYIHVNRREFVQIITAHLKDRKLDTYNLSII